ncbi:uncharacterized protein M6B38_336015 [Iris pallida]|uniref:TRF2/HOY1 PH-like domain-containing protein n=1 Tax=Iris pallida TaxID=29817 RepID=A0AAX6H033_IRIPA|nr:uncharacterized protein M6B38_336015 [Iris pallida]
MVQMANLGKLRRHADPTAKPAPPSPAAFPAVKMEIEDPLEEEHGPLNKRSRSPDNFHQWGGDAATASPQTMHCSLLDEPSPLGLRLRKSPSLLELIQMRLSQGSSNAPSCTTSSGAFDVGKKDLKSTAVSGTSSDKLKASNFPVSLLKIGSWECISRYEGDLVAKCYYAKHKLVWEVLDGGLKSKIEIQWSDITALKATCPENGPGTLDIVLARQPLFFRETNPQPRKHTLWQATSDFTNGQASTNRRHYLQCPQGLLSKHFEKLIQCDPRLHSLSRQPEIVLESLYFEPRTSVSVDQGESKCHAFDDLKDGYGSKISGFSDHGLPCGAPSTSPKNDLRFSIGRIPDNVPRETLSPSSVMDAQVIEENPTTSGTKESDDHRRWDQIRVPGLRSSMSMVDLVNHIEHCISGQTTPRNPLVPTDSSLDRDMLEQLTQYLLTDSYVTSASDEQSLMSRVDSLCCLIQKDLPAAQDSHVDHNVPAGCDDDSSDNEHSFKGNQMFHVSEGEGKGSDGSGSKQQPPNISRKDSYGELLMHLPRIASLPQFLFDIAEDSEKPAR